jgi:hypothetical protein
MTEMHMELFDAEECMLTGILYAVSIIRRAVIAQSV